MFGRFASHKVSPICLGLLIFLQPGFAPAQIRGAKGSTQRAPAQANPKSEKLNPNEWQRGETMVDNATVYAEPDFDSKVIGRLKKGTRWTVSKRVYGAFYQIRLPNGRVGFVTDADVIPQKDAKQVKVLSQELSEKQKAREQKSEKVEGAHFDVRDGKKGPRKFENLNMYGASFTNLRYHEETMGQSLTDDMLLIGYKATGKDVLIDGLNTELNLAFSLGPPKYYEKATGRSADGFLFLMDGMVLANNAHSPYTMTYFGFGPMFRFSKFGVTLPVNGQDEFYSLDDMAVGVKFNLGATLKMGDFAVRLEGQYYWEKQQYYGFSLSLLYGTSPR